MCHERRANSQVELGCRKQIFSDKGSGRPKKLMGDCEREREQCRVILLKPGKDACF